MPETYDVVLLLRTSLVKAYLRQSNISLASRQPKSMEEAVRMQMEDAARNTHAIKVPCNMYVEARVTDDDIAYIFGAKHPVDILEYKQQSPWQFPNGMVVEGIVLEYNDLVYRSYEEWVRDHGCDL